MSGFFSFHALKNERDFYFYFFLQKIPTFSSALKSLSSLCSLFVENFGQFF
jgi:hypothetical protein